MAAGALLENRLEQQLAEQRDVNTALKREVDRLRALQEQTQSTSTTQADQLAIVKAELHKVKAERDQLEDEALVLRQDMKRLRLWEEHKEAEVRTLTEQLAESAAAAQRLLRERVAQEQRAQRLELAVVPQLEADRTRLEGEVQRAKEHQQFLAQELEAQRQAVAAERRDRGQLVCELEAKTTAAVLERDTSSAKLNTTTEQLQQADAEGAKLRRKVAELQDSLLSQELQFTQELGNRERKCAAYATELEQLKSQVDDLTVDLATATAQLEEARGRTGTDDAARDAEVRELTQRCLNAEQEAGRLRGLLQRLNSAGVEEGLPAPRPFPAEGAEASVFALSQTAGAGQALRARGLNSLSETYASGLQALDDAAALRAENAQLQAELKAILAELEARAPEVIANERELRAMQQAFGAMAGRLEAADLEKRALKQKADDAEALRQRVAALTAENKDLSMQLRAVLFEKCDPDPQELDELAVAMGLHLDPKAKAAPKARAGDGRAKKITFRSVDELVARNTQLMGDLRQAEAAQKKATKEAVDNALRDVWAKLKGAQEEVVKLTRDYQAQLKAADVLQTQRDRLFGILKARQLLSPEDMQRLGDPDSAALPGPAAAGGAAPALYAATGSRVGEAASRQVDALKAQVAELSAKLTTERNATAAAQNQVERGAVRLQAAREDEARVQRRLEDAQKEAAQLKAVNSSLVAEQRAGLAAVKEALAEAAAVKGKLAVAEAAERQRAAEAEGLRGQLAAERSQAAARLEQQAMQQKVWETLQGMQGREKATEDLVRRLTAQTEARGEEARQLRQEAEAERAARRHADERAAAAAAEAAEARRGAEDRIARLEKSLAEAEGSRRVLLERTESLAAQLRASEDRAQELLDKISTVAGQEEEEAFLRGEESQLQEAHEAVAELQEKLQQSEAKVKQALDTVAELEGRLRQGEAAETVWQGRVEEERRQMAAKEAEQKALADRLKESVAEVAAAKAEIGKLEKAQEDLKAQHAKEAEALKAETAKVVEELQTERDRHAQAAAGEAAAREEGAEAQRRAEGLEARIAALEAQLKAAQTAGRDQEDDRRATLERLEAEHSAALARVATLEREAEALRAESGAAAELAGTAERLTDLEATVQTLEKANAELRQAAEAAAQERDRAAEELRAAEDALRQAETQREHYQKIAEGLEGGAKSRHSALEEKCSTLSRALEELQDEVSQGKLQLADSQDELEQARGRQAELEKALAEARAAHDACRQSLLAAQELNEQLEGRTEKLEQELHAATQHGPGKHATPRDGDDEEDQPPAKRARPAAEAAEEARAAEYSVLQDLGLVPEDDEVRRASPTPGPAVVVSTVAVVEVQHGAQQAEETVAQRTRRRWAKGVSPEPSPTDPTEKEEALKRQLLQRKAAASRRPQDSPSSSADTSAASGARGSRRKLQVTVLDADNLPAADRSNPHCTVKVGQQQRSTDVAQNTLSPTWNEDFTFDLPDGPEVTVHFTLWQSDAEDAEPIGTCSFNCRDLETGSPKMVTLPAVQASPFGPATNGQLCVSLLLTPP